MKFEVEVEEVKVAEEKTYWPIWWLCNNKKIKKLIINSLKYKIPTNYTTNQQIISVHAQHLIFLHSKIIKTAKDAHLQKTDEKNQKNANKNTSKQCTRKFNKI